MTLSVMLIDDHPVVRAGLRAVLNSFDGVEVVAEAADGDAEVPEGWTWWSPTSRCPARTASR